MPSKNQIFKEMKALEKLMNSVAFEGPEYNSLNSQYEALGAKIGVELYSPAFIRTIKPCTCKSVEISINTEKGRCHFKCVNCGICTPKCENKRDARNKWNDLVKSLD